MKEIEDLGIIREIEETLEIALKQVPFEAIHKKDFYTRNPFKRTLSYIQREDFPYKGAWKYALDGDGRLPACPWTVQPYTFLISHFLKTCNTFNI